MNWLKVSALDRAATARSADALAALWPGARVWQVDAYGRFAARQGRPSLLEQPGDQQPDDIFLGMVAGRASFVRPQPQLTGETITWREIPLDLCDELGAAAALAQWHLSQPRCEICAGPTAPRHGGAQRNCLNCASQLFPRTDPCIIVAVTDPQDRLLLARQHHWSSGRVSVIAGFVEAGESAEQAVHRELAEEVGVRLAELSYVSSQPWPLPRSLMLGFAGRAVDESIVIDGHEIAEASYYTREAVRRALAEDRLVLPSQVSIAYSLITFWLSRG